MPPAMVAPPLVARAGSWRVVEVDGYLPAATSTSTVLDDNKILTLANGDRMPMTDTTTRRNQLTRRVQVLLSGGAGPYLAVIETGSGCDQTAAGPECKKAAKEPRYLGIRTVPLLGGGAYRRGIDVCWLRKYAGLQLHLCLTNNSLRAAGATEALPARTFAFSASNSACVSTPESSSSFKPFSFATVSDISAATITAWNGEVVLTSKYSWPALGSRL